MFFRPDGTVVPPAPPPLPATAASAVTGQNRQLGLDIGPHTAMPYWAGERLDLGLALDALFSPEAVRPPGVTGARMEVVTNQAKDHATRAGGDPRQRPATRRRAIH